MFKPIGLGDRVKDPITGFTGIVVVVATWLHGCTAAQLAKVLVMPDSPTPRTKPYGMDFFMGPKDDAGVPFEDFVKAVAVWSWMRPGAQPPTRA